MTLPARYISISIARPFREVYDFVSNPENLPLWAAGLSGSISNIDGAWIAESGMGRVRVEFAPSNEFGVLDHTVTLATRRVVLQPDADLRQRRGQRNSLHAVPQPGVDDEAFEADAAAVARDLATLKGILEL